MSHYLLIWFSGWFVTSLLAYCTAEVSKTILSKDDAATFSICAAISWPLTLPLLVIWVLSTWFGIIFNKKS